MVRGNVICKEQGETGEISSDIEHHHVTGLDSDSGNLLAPWPKCPVETLSHSGISR